MNFHDMTGSHKFGVYIPPAAAGDATIDLSVWVAPYAVKVTALTVYTNAAVTGANTNSCNLNIQKVIGGVETEVANRDFLSGTNLAVGGTALTVTAFTLAAGDMIVVEREKVGTGLALPVLTLEITAQGN